MNILCIGDVVGKPGRDAVERLLDDLKEEFRVDLVIVNVENAAGGSGVTSKIAKHFLEIGCDVLTSGDHVWDQKELEEYLKEEPFLLRPANFPEGAPGRGWCIKSTPSGIKVGVVNMIGRVFMRYNVDCPFRALDTIIEEIKKETSIIVVDMHAEATSEKVAMGHYGDGRVSCVFGTHTHIQTADEKILPNGTAYITDLGMTGPYDSVIGQKKENILRRFLTSLPLRFNVADGEATLHGIVIEIDEKTGKALHIMRIQREDKAFQEQSGKKESCSAMQNE
ncbi:MAG: TIGR00282 family metallophosphoesterase [Candidatus Omnitrophica bacterium]|nr:TIGR00282 family metallophosphoesterase [Candidatus Omnitrophota bacterium]